MPLFRRSQPEKRSNDRFLTPSKEDAERKLKKDIESLRGDVELAMCLIGRSALPGWLYYLHCNKTPGFLTNPSRIATLVTREFEIIEVNDTLLLAPKIRIIKEERFDLERSEERVTTDVTIHPDNRANYIVDSVYRATSNNPDKAGPKNWASMPTITGDGGLQFTELTARATRIAYTVGCPSDGEEPKKVKPFGLDSNPVDQMAAVGVAVTLLGEVKLLDSDRSGSLTTNP